MKTTSLKEKDIQRKWLLIDATGERLGPLASTIAAYLSGKNKAAYTSNLDCGDYVIVINAKDVEIHPSKRDTKMYYRHSGYPGGLKTTTFAQMKRKDPSRVISLAVKGMLPGTKLGNALFKKLFIYNEENHPHKAQKAEKISLDRSKS